MKKEIITMVTLEQVQKWQRQAAKLEKENGNRVEIWYNLDTGSHGLYELTGQDYLVDEKKRYVCIPWKPNYYDYSTKAARDKDLLRRTQKAVDEINAICE